MIGNVTVLLRIVATLSVSFFMTAAEARVFDFKNEHVALYFGGSFGSTNVSSGAFTNATPNDVIYDRQVQTASSAEFGLMFSTRLLNFRFGGEYLMPRDQAGINATNTAGAALFSLTSKVSAIIPMVTIELMPYRGVLTRGLIGVGYGYALVSMSNEYTMAAAGTARWSKADYKEVGTGGGSFMQGYLGWEFLFTDTTTAAISAGVRYCRVASMTSSQDTNAIGGQQTTGQEIFNSDGSHRSLDLGGGFLAINFRFYL